MAITLAKKKTIVNELVEDLKSSSAVYLVDYKGISEADDNLLRKQLFAKGIKYRVVKNTLIQRAFSEVGLSGIENYLRGVTALAFGDAEEPMLPAKEFKSFINGREEQFKVKAISLDGQLIDGSKLDDVASMPGRKEMLSRIVSIILGPGAALVAAINGPATTIAGQIKAVEKKLQG
jgi:large subunit ribosomal protein L10